MSRYNIKAIFFTAWDINMLIKRINLTYMVFATLCIALVSAISTVIFSEKTIHDNLGFSLMVLATIGLFFNIINIITDKIIDICNP